MTTALGPAPDRITESDTPLGPVAVRHFGTGAPIVLVHGALVDGHLWDAVLPALASEGHVLVPDLPLGAHRRPVPDRNRLDPQAVADVVAGLADGPAVLVGNDTGGAVVQLAATAHPHRVAGLVLTSCDAYDEFPPRILRLAARLLGVPGSPAVASRLYRSSLVRRSFLGTALVAKHRIDPAVVEHFFGPVSRDVGVARDLAAFLGRCRPQLTLAAAERFPELDVPALVAWSTEDRLFPPAHARRLVEDLPDADLVWIDDAYAFSMLDQPEVLGAAIATFVRRVAATPASRGGGAA